MRPEKSVCRGIYGNYFKFSAQVPINSREGEFIQDRFQVNSHLFCNQRLAIGEGDAVK